MIEIRQTEEFGRWFAKLRDVQAKAHILRRIERMEAGNVGDVSVIGDGVVEARIHHGPGYRLYFMQHGGQWIVLLCGGDKGSQQRDIDKALKLVKDIGI